MEQDAIQLLKKLDDETGEISIYTLVDSELRERNTDLQAAFDKVVRSVYALASRGLVALSVRPGEDGNETYVKATPIGEAFLSVELPTQ